MRHSGNNSVTVSSSYGLGQVRVKQYVYDELGRIVTVSTARFDETQLRDWLEGIAMWRANHEQDELPF